MRIARSVTRLYWMTIFELKGPLHSHCRVPSGFFVQTPQKIAQNRLIFCAFHRRNKVTDEPRFRLLLQLYGQKKKPGIGENPNPVAVKCPFVTVPVYVEPFSRHNPVAIAVFYGANPVAVATFWT